MKDEKGSKAINCEKWELQLEAEVADVFALDGTVVTE